MKYILSLIFLALSIAVLSAQTTLAYHLKKDDVFTIRQNAKQVITQELDGATHELTNNSSGIMEFKVLTAGDSTYNIALTFKELNLKMISSIQGELMNVNAKELNDNDIQSKIFNSLLNRPVQLVLAKTGDILEVNGGDSLVVKMAEASGLEDEFSLNMMKKSLHKEFGSEALSNNYKQLTFIYPEKKVKVGDHWENEYSGHINAKNSWTLEALSSDNVNISGTANVKMDLTELATTMKLNGTHQTRIIANLASGFIQKMTVEGLAIGSSTMTEMGDQEIPTTIKSIVTYEIVDDLRKPINN